MGGEKTWWTWTVASRGSLENGSYTLFPINPWNNSFLIEDAFNLSSNGTWPDEFLVTGRFDLLLTILTATVLGALILITIIGE